MYLKKIDAIILEKAKKVKLLALDVDGVLTDGGIIYDSKGEQIQRFHVQDGLGIKLLEKAGIPTAIITSRKSEALKKRCEDLDIKLLFQGINRKKDVLDILLDELSMSYENVCYIGDDLVDLPVLVRVGFSVAVSDCNEAILSHVHYRTFRNGGYGAVREVCDIILMAQGKYNVFLNDFLS